MLVLHRNISPLFVACKIWQVYLEAYCLMSYMLLKSEDGDEGVMIVLCVKGQVYTG